MSGSAATLAGPVSEAVRALDPAMPVQSMRTMEDYYYASARNFNTVTVRTVAGMGVAGLVLALAGLDGLVAYAVSRRTREIGIRMALGAVPQSMLRMVLWHGWLPTAAGMLAGVLLSAAAGRLLRSAFQGGAGIDAGSYLLVVPAVLVVVTAAAYVPARRAARLDPLVALRQD